MNSCQERVCSVAVALRQRNVVPHGDVMIWLCACHSVRGQCIQHVLVEVLTAPLDAVCLAQIALQRTTAR